MGRPRAACSWCHHATTPIELTRGTSAAQGRSVAWGQRCGRARLLALYALVASCHAELDVATEELTLRPLPNDELLLHLNLSVSAGADLRDLELFPRPIAELALGSGVLEAGLALSSGRWLPDLWGALPERMPPGGTVSAALPVSRAAWGWPALRRSLGALLCTSIEDGVFDPATPWGRDFDLERDRWHGGGGRGDGDGDGDGGGSGAVWLRATAARQSVCTENLAAWLQLWPCRDVAGITALLSPDNAPTAERVRSARFRALQLRLVQWRREEERLEEGGRREGGRQEAGGAPGHPAEDASVYTHASVPGLRLQLQLTLVLPRVEGARVEGARVEGGRVAPPAEPLAGRTPQDPLGSLLRGGLSACGLASRSTLRVQLPVTESAQFAFSAQPSRAHATEPKGGSWREAGQWSDFEWDLHPRVPLPLTLRRISDSPPHLPTSRAFRSIAAVQARRVMARHDDSSGRMVLRVKNDAPLPVSLRCLDVLPPWLQLHAHSLRAFLNTSLTDAQTLLRHLHIQPPTQLGAPQLVEWDARLPAHSSLTLDVRYSISLLRVDELPADSSRGLELGAAEVHYRHDGSGQPAEVAYTEPVLVPVLLPDLSMPYNVISISSTVLALFVGSMFNLLARPPRVAMGAGSTES